MEDFIFDGIKKRFLCDFIESYGIIMKAVGIDLGTTNSLISVMEESGPKLIPNVLGNFLTPSVIGLDDNGNILIGDAAKHRLVTHPEKTAAYFKRYMGTDHVFELGKTTYRAEELSALILKSLKEDAEKYLSQSVNEVVISVPAYFDDNQRKATISAAEIAGLKVTRLINEPTAAAIAHGVHNKTDESTFIVLDLGGGTFDVSILEMFEGVMEVRASAGDAFLGGEDFTDCLAKFFAEKLKLDWNKQDKGIKADIRDVATRAKHQLGKDREVTAHIVIEGEKRELYIDRPQFADICDTLLKKMRRPIERSMYDTGLQVEQIDKLILVGGATRMPVIKSLASKLFQRLPEQNIDPDNVIALGAAVQAGLCMNHEALDDVVMTDVCPFTLGIETATKAGKHIEEGLFSPIIERNAVVPVSRVESFSTIEDRQRNIRLKIYQGEAPKVMDNVFLGEIDVPIPSAKAGVELVDVRFTYDPSGILEADVAVQSTGLQKKLVIEKTPGKMSKEEIAKRMKALESLKIHPREDVKNRALLARLSKLYEMTLGDDREYVGELVRNFEMCLSRQNPSEIEKMYGEVSEVLDKIESHYVF